MADRFVFSNFAVSTLLESVGPTDVTLQLNVDDVSRFPELVGGTKFPIILADSDDIVEVMYATLVEISGLVTVERGREGTVAQSWLAGTLVRHAFTASSVRSAAGFRPRGEYTAGTLYEPNDVVSSDGVSYIAVNETINIVPSAENANWQAIYQPPGAASTALNWQGRWNVSTTYAVGQGVEYAGRVWQATGTSTGSIPAFGNPDWSHLAKWSGSASFGAVLAFAGTNNYSVAIAPSEAPVVYYDGMTVVGRFGISNTNNTTLAINGLPAVPLRFRSGVELGAGDIVAGELYEFVYVSGTSEFLSKQVPRATNQLAILAAAQAAQATIPTGLISEFGGGVAPAGWALCDGAEVSRTGATAALWAVVGDAYGAGNGTTTFNLPDFRGRTSAMPPGLTGRIGIGVTGGFSAVILGSVGGESSHTLTLAEIPVHSHALTDPGHTHGVTDPGHTHLYNKPAVTFTVNLGVNHNVWDANVSADTTGASVAGITVSPAVTGITVGNAGTGQVHNNMQPTLLVNKIIKL